MRLNLMAPWLARGVLAGVLLVMPLPAMNAQTGNPAPGSPPSETRNPNAATAQAGQVSPKSHEAEIPANTFSAGINDIIKMVQAGISKELLKTYIENSPVPYNLSPADLIALKERGVADDITTALIKRGAVVRTQTNPIAAPVEQVREGGSSGRDGLDPEG